VGTVKLKGSFVRAAVPGCCPQTGVLSPLLWCLFVDDLIARLNKDGVNTHFYADDIRGGGEQGRSLWAIFEKKAQYLCR